MAPATTDHRARDHDLSRARRPVIAPAMVDHRARDEAPSRPPWSLVARIPSSHDDDPTAIASTRGSQGSERLDDHVLAVDRPLGGLEADGGGGAQERPPLEPERAQEQR